MEWLAQTTIATGSLQFLISRCLVDFSSCGGLDSPAATCFRAWNRNGSSIGPQPLVGFILPPMAECFTDFSESDRRLSCQDVVVEHRPNRDHPARCSGLGGLQRTGRYSCGGRHADFSPTLVVSSGAHCNPLGMAHRSLASAHFTRRHRTFEHRCRVDFRVETMGPSPSRAQADSFR